MGDKQTVDPGGESPHSEQQQQHEQNNESHGDGGTENHVNLDLKQNNGVTKDCNGVDSSPQTDKKRPSIVYVKQQSRMDEDEDLTNLSIHREFSTKSMESEDSFHQTPQTVISPHNPVTQTNTSQPHIANKRFSVSKVQGIPNAGITRPPSGIVRQVSRGINSKIVFNLGDGDEYDDQEIDLHHGRNGSTQSNVPLLNNHNEVYSAYRRGESLEMKDGASFSSVDVDDFISDAETSQRTYRSECSVNTEDSSIFRYAPLKCGNIGFVRETSEYPQSKKHYVCVSSDTQMETVSSFMHTYWGLKSPKIVLSVISDTENFKPWKRQQLKDDFQKGIIKAANATAMWIVTNGIDAGVTKIIGDAVKEYNLEQQNIQLVNQLVMTDVELRKRRLPILGIVRKEMVPYSAYFDGTEGVQVRNYGTTMETDMYELNPDHSHFILVDEMSKDFPQDMLRCMIEKQFSIKRGNSKLKRLMSVASNAGEQHYVSQSHEYKIPVVSLLVQGTASNIDHVLFYLQNKLPVIVLKGSGGLSEMISFAYEEIVGKGEADPDFEENFLKPELIKMINRMFPLHFEDNEMEKLTLRDKIIQSVKLGNEGVDTDHSYITIVNVKGLGSNMKDLDKFILRALFKTMKPETMDIREQLQNDLQLTIDWNRPDLAGEIFQHDLIKVRIDKKMFEQSLIQKEREQFIDLFLSQGVKIHSYLNPRKLKYLFEKAEDRELFVSVCLEGILGLNMSSKEPLGPNFLTETLNRLIYKVARIRHFTQPQDLYMSSVGFKLDSVTAERKAINYLIIWAVLMNRQKLAKTLWNRCDEPIGVALVCSRMYKEMSKYCKERYRRTELEENAKEFGEMALGALAICWRDSSLQAYNMLGKKLTDFNDKTVIDIAHDAGYIHFLAHPCCQRWLTRSFHGQMQIKELDWGIFRLPYWFKILASVFLIFPMYIWITFKTERKLRHCPNGDEEYNYNNNESDGSDDEDQTAYSTKTLNDPAWKRRKEAIRRKLKSVLPFKKDNNSISFFMKIFLLWSAPITKFWITQVFYFAYLGLFSLATLWPVCGNHLLDVILWGWTAIIELELIYRVYVKYHKYKNISLTGNYLDISFIAIFLVLLLFTRVLFVWVSFTNYIQAKSFMCFGLIYFFYRLLGVYLPISPTLGPMLLRIKRMVKHDFVTFIRMFLIFMIAGGVTIQAVLYPHWPLNIDLIRRVITRPIYAMFLTQVQDLDGDLNCNKKYRKLSGYCAAGPDGFYNYGLNQTKADDLAVDLEQCPHSSFAAYVITIQYLLICKLVLVTLLFAMFSLTISKVDKEASVIWKYQRYSLIMDFKERFPLPPPFTVLCFGYYGLKYVYRGIRSFRKSCQSLSSCCSSDEEKRYMTAPPTKIEDTTFWKRVAREYVDNEDAKLEKDNILVRHGEILVSIQEDLRSNRKTIKRLGDKVVELERMIQSSRLYLEDVQHKLEKTDVMGITNIKGNFIHVATRQSPYPGTSIARFPVFDKYVPWEVVYDVYDPKTYTLSQDKFPKSEIQYVDEDIIELNRLREERMVLTDEEERKRLPTIPEFQPKWNAVITYREMGERREIDRRSWINTDNQPLRYTLDVLNIPQNPLGRTGIRGKGSLWRWGPNHVIKAVVTRWRRKQVPDGSNTTGYLYVEGKRVLEFVSVYIDTMMESGFGLPGDVLLGSSDPYSVLCKSVVISVLNEPRLADKIEKFNQAEMIQFFSQFASSSPINSESPSPTAPSEVALPTDTTFNTQLLESDSKTNLSLDTDEQGFSASLLYKGYLDDPRNTDNAWVESEVWNFHYDLNDTFDLTIKEESNVKWKEVSPYVKMFGNECVIVQEAARIHDAYH